MDASQLFVVALVAGVAVLWLRFGRTTATPSKPRDASNYGSGGTSRFATANDLSHLKPTGGGFIFGRERLAPGIHLVREQEGWTVSWGNDRRAVRLTVGRSGRRFRCHFASGSHSGLPLILPPALQQGHNQNVTVIGASNTQKTTTVVQPNILQAVAHASHSLIVLDPKGENYRRSAALLRSRDFRVHLLNLVAPAHSDRWNPLDAVTGVTDAVDLAVNVVANTINPNRPRTGDPFWDNAEQAFLTALTLYIKRHRPAEEQHISSVLELGTDLGPEALDGIFLALGRQDPARRFYRSFLRAEEKIRAGVVAGLGSRLQLWNSAEIAGLTSSSDFHLAEFGEKPCALFLVIPDSKATYAPLLALFWQQAFETLYRVADEHGGELPVHVRCLMDEIANCGFIPDYEKKKSTMRSRGVSTVEIWQNLTQMQNRYPSWEELLGNADHLLFLGANDLKTADYIAKMTGQTTIQTHAVNSGQSGSSVTSGQSDSYTGRPLMTADEVLRLPLGQALLFPRAGYPARICKWPYWEHPLAGQIQEEPHYQYQPCSNSKIVTTDVEALCAAIRARAPAPESPEETADVSTDDPLDFLDSPNQPEAPEPERKEEDDPQTD